MQKRATEMFQYLEKMTDSERLKELNLFSLLKRRLRGDLISIQVPLQGENCRS